MKVFSSPFRAVLTAGSLCALALRAEGGDSSEELSLQSQNQYEGQISKGVDQASVEDAKDPVLPSAPRSDTLAQLVTDHQTLAHKQMRRALAQVRAALAADPGFGSENPLDERTQELIREEVEALLAVFLFKDEAPWDDRRIEGGDAFRWKFVSEGQRDEQWRSLRIFDLDGHLFRYRLSYMIHSRAFAKLPEPFTELFFERLDEILDGRDPAYHYLPAWERTNIRKILTTTLADYPGISAAEAAARTPIPDDILATYPEEPAADAVPFGGSRYKVFDDEDRELSWQQKKVLCERMGGHLAVIETRKEQAFIVKLADGRYLSLGASDEKEEGDWRWVNGADWGPVFWAEDQPNNYGGEEHYLATYDSGLWVDVAGAGYGFWMPTGFICEWENEDLAEEHAPGREGEDESAGKNGH